MCVCVLCLLFCMLRPEETMLKKSLQSPNMGLNGPAAPNLICLQIMRIHKVR